MGNLEAKPPIGGFASKYLQINAVVVTVIVTITPISQENGLKTEQIVITGQEITVEIADTPEERARGLSGRAPIKENEGMLFIFKSPGLYPFWMKDMLFSIDIIWIGEDSRVVGVEENVSPDTFPQTFSPSGPVQYVLEVPAGWSRTKSIKAGNFLIWK